MIAQKQPGRSDRWVVELSFHREIREAHEPLVAMLKAFLQQSEMALGKNPKRRRLKLVLTSPSLL